MISKSPGLTLLEAHNFNRWAAKNPDQLLSAKFIKASKGSEKRDIFNNRPFFLEKPLVIQAGVLYLLMRLFV